MAIITLWSRPGCQPCKAVERRLETAGAEFEKFDLTAPEHELQFKEFIDQGINSVPITEFEGSIVLGYHTEALDELIEKQRIAA